MNISKQQLNKAAEDKVISAEQAERLYAYLQAQSKDVPQFSLTHVLYYLGGMLAIGAMTLFMNLGWEAFGGLGILSISIVYAVIGMLLTRGFDNKNLFIPAGICATFVVCLAPLAIYGLQQWLGVWPDDSVYREYHRYIKWHWIYMELGTLLVGLVMAWRYKYPFLILPIAVTLWYMSMDVAVMIAGDDSPWTLRKLVSLYSGLLMIGLAFWLDLRSRKSADYAFWLYIFGVIAFWGGLTSLNSDSELAKFFYFCINLLMIGVGVLLMRRVFALFGGLGSFIYLSHLASDVFKDSWLFPISLSLIGLGIVYIGVLWQKHERGISEKARSILPSALQDILARRS